MPSPRTKRLSRTLDTLLALCPHTKGTSVPLSLTSALKNEAQTRGRGGQNIVMLQRLPVPPTYCSRLPCSSLVTSTLTPGCHIPEE
jgi:hypothetical protein